LLADCGGVGALALEAAEFGGEGIALGFEGFGFGDGGAALEVEGGEAGEQGGSAAETEFFFDEREIRPHKS